MALSQFISVFRTAFESGQFLKCTLSRPAAAAPADLKNVYLRPVSLKKGVFVSFTFRYKTRDEVKNLDLQAALDYLSEWLGKGFLSADLFTSDHTYSLHFSKSGEATLTSKKTHCDTPADTSHNREKHRLIAPSAPWLHALGITNAKGEVLPTAQDKWKQINKFLEIIESLLRAHPLPPGAQIADMGSGKGYLTFALYDFLRNNLGLDIRVTGIELRQNLVDFCNKTAAAAGFSDLHFVAADINDYHPERLDVLIALHACDTATDLALAKGIHARAGIVIVAPCCHKQIRKEMDAHNELAPVLRHGILEERQAEIVTDGIRALLLEANGYKTNVFEFISTEHTAKNVMITAIEAGRSTTGGQRRDEALEKVAALKSGFGIREHYLEGLLKETP